MHHMNCLLVELKRHHRNWYCVKPNVFWIVERTAILIVIDIIFKLGKSLETLSNAILWLSFRHCTSLSQAIKGLDFWLLVFIIHLIGAEVQSSWSWWCCLVAFALSSWYRNTSCWAFVSGIWNAASWSLDYWYTCLENIIALFGSSELALGRLPSRRIRSEKWFSKLIYTKLKSDSSTSCCAISALICILFLSPQRHFAVTEWLFHAGSVACSPVCPM